MRARDKQLINNVLLDYPDLRVYIRKGDWSTFWKELRKISFGANSRNEYHDAYAIFILLCGELNIGKGPNLFPIWSFYRQKDLDNLIIPEGIKTLGNDCFRESAFNSIKLPTTLKKIEYESFLKSNLSEIVLPDKLEIISSDAFNTTNLSKINLPSRLKSIGNGCFINCNIPEITVPESVEELGSYCFYNLCSGKDIIVNLPKKWSRKPPLVKKALGAEEDKPIKKKNQWVFEGIGLGYSITVNFY